MLDCTTQALMSRSSEELLQPWGKMMCLGAHAHGLCGALTRSACRCNDAADVKADLRLHHAGADEPLLRGAVAAVGQDDVPVCGCPCPWIVWSPGNTCLSLQ